MTAGYLLLVLVILVDKALPTTTMDSRSTTTPTHRMVYHASKRMPRYKSLLNCVAYLCYVTVLVSIRRILGRKKGNFLHDLPWLSEIGVRYLRYSINNTVKGAREIESAIAKVSNLTTKEKSVHLQGDGFHGHWIGEDNADQPLLLYFHGGAYSFCSSLTYLETLGQLRRLAGVRIFSLEYGLAPATKFPGQLNEALAATRFLLKNRKPGQTLFVMGDSAGGNLVLALLQRLDDAERKQIAGAILIAPWVDLSRPALTAQNAVYDYFDQDQIGPHVEDFIPAGVSPTDPLISPVYADLKGFCPLLVYYGAREVLAGDIERFIERARETTGLDVEVFRDPVAPHVAVMLPQFFPTISAAGLDSFASFVKRKAV
ncbi:Alpha/Beta hydrolase protein [Cladochytrium replicatum]|nr:Alpha/Beta hydrolase protein [Cladochytrium replicatum]